MASLLRKGMLAVIVNFCCVLSFAVSDGYAANLMHRKAADPSNATYTIGDQKVSLQNGLFEGASAPGAATKSRAHILSEPVFGDLDGDGDEDAVLFIVVDPGGSGTFYYVAAALRVEGGYHGTVAVLLGDRLTPQNLKIRNGVVVAIYADRLPGESMSITPSVTKSVYLILTEGNLFLAQAPGKKEIVFEGWVTIDHEVRAIRPCSMNTDLWLSGHSPALETIKGVYRGTVIPADYSYRPLFMTIAGQLTESPPHGFGADYPGALMATQLIQVWPKGHCKSNLILVDSPLPGAVISSPLKITGQARGMWFFEGDFPVSLVNPDGTALSQGFCTAKGDWMTEAFVPFEGLVTFTQDSTVDRGMLVFKKDNPTGNPEFDDAIEIPVFFKQ